MNNLEQANAPVEKGNASSEETLVALNAFIEFYTGKVIHDNCKNLSRDACDQLMQEVAQSTRIKTWLALQERKVEHLKAYIMCIIYHEFISIVRQKSRFVQMLTGENGETVQNSVMFVQDEMLRDPAVVLERRLDVEERMQAFAKATQLLPSRQMQAILCSMIEKVDDIIGFKKVIEDHHIDIEVFVWPDNEADKKLLKASIQPARRKVAQLMGIAFPRK